MKKQVVTLTAILAFGSMNCFAATTADNLQNPTQVQQVQPQDQSNHNQPRLKPFPQIKLVRKMRKS